MTERKMAYEAVGSGSRHDLLAELAYQNPEAVMPDGFADAFMGICRRFSEPPLAAYSYERCIEILMDQGLSHEKAIEHLESSVLGSWCGKGTPVFIATYEIIE